MRNILSILIVLLFTFNAQAECVSEAQLEWAHRRAISKSELNIFGGTSTIPAVCNPCSCPTSGMAACYEWMAKEAREEESAQRQMLDIFERFKQYGICE